MDTPRTEPQFIKTPSGEELAILPRHDYEALIDALAEAQEELADIAVLDVRLAEIATNPVPPFPPEVNRLIGQRYRRIAALRIWRGLSVEELAAKSGLNAVDIEALEAGERMQTNDEADRLAAALQVLQGWVRP